MEWEGKRCGWEEEDLFGRWGGDTGVAGWFGYRSAFHLDIGLKTAVKS